VYIDLLFYDHDQKRIFVHLFDSNFELYAPGQTQRRLKYEMTTARTHQYHTVPKSCGLNVSYTLEVQTPFMLPGIFSSYQP
jgi:hypothetical protein